MMNDIRYDILTVLQSKLEALDAYRRYIEDCDKTGDTPCRRIFEGIQRDDQRHVDQLWSELSRHLRTQLGTYFGGQASGTDGHNPVKTHGAG